MTATQPPPPVRAAAEFRARTGIDPQGVWSAPGRVNLIGEHTDYNAGLVLPFALPMRIAVAGTRRSGGLLRVATLDRDGHARKAPETRIADLRPGSVFGWFGYPAGVAWSLHRAGLLPEAVGADLLIAGNLPAGAGLSSSASLECATALALLELAGNRVDAPGGPSRADVAAWAQQAENEFVGVPTGVLDQTAAMCCTAGNALYLDVRSGHSEQVPFAGGGDGPIVLVIDTGVRAASEPRHCSGWPPCARSVPTTCRALFPGCPTSCAGSCDTW